MSQLFAEHSSPLPDWRIHIVVTPVMDDPFCSARYDELKVPPFSEATLNERGIAGDPRLKLNRTMPTGSRPVFIPEVQQLLSNASDDLQVAGRAKVTLNERHGIDVSYLFAEHG